MFYKVRGRLKDFTTNDNRERLTNVDIWERDDDDLQSDTGWELLQKRGTQSNVGCVRTEFSLRDVRKIEESTVCEYDKNDGDLVTMYYYAKSHDFSKITDDIRIPKSELETGFDTSCIKVFQRRTDMYNTPYWVTTTSQDIRKHMVSKNQTINVKLVYKDDIYLEFVDSTYELTEDMAWGILLDVLTECKHKVDKRSSKESIKTYKETKEGVVEELFFNHFGDEVWISSNESIEGVIRKEYNNGRSIVSRYECDAIFYDVYDKQSNILTTYNAVNDSEDKIYRKVRILDDNYRAEVLCTDGNWVMMDVCFDILKTHMVEEAQTLFNINQDDVYDYYILLNTDEVAVSNGEGCSIYNSIDLPPGNIEFQSDVQLDDYNKIKLEFFSNFITNSYNNNYIKGNYMDIIDSELDKANEIFQKITNC